MPYLTIILAYILAHGTTAFVVTPIQARILPELTVFASLVYLPHGVRVLATWAYGWKAIPALILGVSLSAWVFTPRAELDFLSPALLEGIVLGAVSAFVAFEILRLAGYNAYFGEARKLHWKGLIAIGALSSIINSVGHSIIYAGLVGPGHAVWLLLIYAIGDLVGLILCMGILMLVFRWSRLLRPRQSSR